METNLKKKLLLAMGPPSTATPSTSRSKKGRSSKKWNSIPILSIADVREMSEEELTGKFLDKGFCIRFFRQDMHCSYIVASHHVLITRGVLDYVHDFNQLGPNKSRHKLFLCSEFSKSKACINGSRCREVHCILPIESAVEANIFGVMGNATGAPNLVEICDEGTLRRQNNLIAPFDSYLSNELSLSGSFASDSESNAAIKMPENVILQHSLHSRWTSKWMYRTLPPGVTFQIALPNTPTPVEEYDSGDIFYTRGANEYYEQIKKHHQSPLSMQHCAHLTKNGLCCFGEDCAFVHVVHQRHRDNHLMYVSDGSFCKGDSFVRNDSSNSSRKKGNNTKETPLSIVESPNMLYEVHPMNNGMVPAQRNPPLGQGNNAVQRPYYAPPVPSQYGGKAMPIFVMSAGQCGPIHPQGFSYPQPNLSSPYLMMPDSNSVQQSAGWGAVSKPLYVFQQLYVPQNSQN